MPLAKKLFAVRRKNSGGEVFPTDDEPAGMAMGRVISLAGRSLSTAVRHADARSLAVPVPRGTKIPSNCQPTIDTVSPPRATDSCVAGALATTISPVRIIHLRNGIAIANSRQENLERCTSRAEIATNAGKRAVSPQTGFDETNPLTGSWKR